MRVPDPTSSASWCMRCQSAGLSAPRPSVAAMDSPPCARRRLFEVLVTVTREDGGEPLVPRPLPEDVLGCWSAGELTVSARVLALRPSRAVAAVEALVPELARAAGAAVTVRGVASAPPGSAVIGDRSPEAELRAERGLALLREAAAKADPGKAARMMAHVKAQAGRLPLSHRRGR
jgi:hypothetical protein